MQVTANIDTVRAANEDEGYLLLLFAMIKPKAITLYKKLYKNSIHISTVKTLISGKSTRSTKHAHVH